MTLTLLLLIAALVVLTIATLGITAGRINLLAAGAALAVAAWITQVWP